MGTAVDTQLTPNAIAFEKIGICILNYNSDPATLTECIRSVAVTLNGNEHSVVIVDNNSDEGSLDTVRKQFQTNVTFISNSQNLGYARGNNVGAKWLLKQHCKYIGFINPDVRVRSDTIRSFVEVLNNNRRAGCVGGSAVINGFVWTRSFRNKPSFKEKVLLYGILRLLPLTASVLSSWIERLRTTHYIPPSSLKNGASVYAVSGACIMFPTHVFQQIGGFDERTFLFEEELIISEKLTAANYTSVAAPEAYYEHVGGHVITRHPLRSFWHFITSEQYLVRRYYRWKFFATVLLGFRCSELLAYAFVISINTVRAYAIRKAAINQVTS